MNILYITDCDPNASSNGNEQRTRLLNEALRQIGEVFILQSANCEETVNDRHWTFHLEPPRGLKRKINGRWSRIVNVACPHMQAKYYPFHFLPDIQHFFPDVHFDLVVSRYLKFANTMHLWQVAPLFVDLDDHPMEVFKTRLLHFVPPRRRALALLLQRFSIWAGLRHATGIWVTNPSQEKLVARYGKTAVLPNIPFTMPDSQPDSPRRKYVLTIGKMSYEPNHQGVDHFIREVWPHVHEAFPNISYLVVGKGVPEHLAKKWSCISGVSVLGFVDDLNELYAGALATIVPIYSGGGTCIKVLESLAYSRICLSSEFGSRGIPASDIASGNCGIFVCHDADDFVSNLMRVVHDTDWRDRTERAARAYVSSRYSRQRFFKQVHSLLQ